MCFMMRFTLIAVLLLGACRPAAPPAEVRPAAPAAQASPPAPPTLPAAPADLQLLAGDGKTGPAPHLSDPYGLAFGPDGLLYVADGSNILRIARDGAITPWIDGRAAGLDSVSGLAFDAQGQLIVADTGHHRILRIGPDGTIQLLAGSGRPGFRDGQGAAAQFDMPMGVAVDADGNVLVADTFNDRIRRIAPNGAVLTLAGGPLPGDVDGPGEQARLNTPCAIAVDAQGRIWIADTRNDALRELTAQGELRTVLKPDPKDDEADLRRPLALAAAPDGRLFIAVQDRGRVLAMGPDGQLTRLIEGTRSRLSRPAALAVDPKSLRLAVSDAAGHRVHEIVDAGKSGNPVAGPAPDAALPDTQGRWPLAPQRGWHEVVGTLGEVRATRHHGLDHLHAGLDVRGDVGEPVFAIANGKVTSPLAASGFGGLGEALAIDDLTYVHLRVGRSAGGRPLDARRAQLLRDAHGRLIGVRVRRGAEFKVGDMLGTINAMAHVHLQLGPPGAQRNPLLLQFKGFADSVPPTLDAVTVQDGQISAEGWDQVDGNLPRRRLGLYALAYQILDEAGRPLPGFESPHAALQFDQLPPDEDAVAGIYVPASGITLQGSKVTRFIYKLGAWPALRAGHYRLRVTARDFSGNETQRETEVTVN
jgi:sugar lactone lactonase YvrE